ncbi:MAG: CotH kinase family protein [Flavobacteriales bacterium]
MKHWPTVLAVLLPFISKAQGAGNELFDTDQVIEIQLTFAQPGYWDSLTTYYEEGLERNLLASVTLIDAMGIYAYDSVGVRLKGNSSYGLPEKKSMKIDFNEYVSGQKYHGLKKINLNNGFNDPTMLREKVFFDYCLEQGVLAPRAGFGDLYINGSLWGFYGVVEQVDKTFLDRWVDDQDGNLFKAGDNFGMGGGSAADLAWYGSAQSSYATRYEQKTNEDLNDWSDLLELINVLNNSTDIEAEFPDMWVWEPMLRSLAIDNIFSNLDAYINSARNYYIYHDSTTLHWNWIKWDANEAFGRYSSGVPNLLNLAPNYVANSRPLMTKIMNTPSFYSDYLVQYCTALENFTNAHLDQHIDSLADMVRSHVYADPNMQYTNAQFESNLASNITVTGGMGSQTVFGLKSFISSRRSYLTGVLDCATVGIAEPAASGMFIVSPNPCTDVLTVSLPDGAALRNVALMDATGRALPVRVFGRTIDLSTLRAGLYVLSVEINGHVLQQRVVKE